MHTLDTPVENQADLVGHGKGNQIAEANEDENHCGQSERRAL